MLNKVSFSCTKKILVYICSLKKYLHAFNIFPGILLHQHLLFPVFNYFSNSSSATEKPGANNLSKFDRCERFC